MEMNRVEAFSDGVIAVIITIMVLELKVPEDASHESLQKVMPHFLAYILSFVTVGIIWSNHHHLLKGASHPNSRLMWANNNLLFWMSLIPFVTAYMASQPWQALPVAMYGVVMMLMGFGFAILRFTILRQRHASVKDATRVQLKMQWKDLISSIGFMAAIGFAFVDQRISYAIYVAIPVTYFLPDLSFAEQPRKNG